MKKGTKTYSQKEFEDAIKLSGKEIYHLKLYVTGSTPSSTRAIANIREICEVYLKGKYELEVIDLYQQPDLAKSDQIIAAPTLVKKLPLPMRKLIGDLSGIEKVVVGLDLKK